MSQELKHEQKTIINVTKNDRLYQLICDHTSPLGELHDVLSMMKADVINMMLEHEAAEKQGCE